MPAARRSVGKWRRPGLLQHRLEGRLLAEDGALEALEGGARLDPELLDEQLPRLLVDGERFGLAPVAVEGEHELAAEALAVRVLRDEGLELGDEVAAVPEGEVGVDPLLEGGQSQLLEAGDLRLCERLVGEVGERRAVPEGERLSQKAGGALVLAFLPGLRPSSSRRSNSIRSSSSELSSST